MSRSLALQKPSPRSVYTIAWNYKIPDCVIQQYKRILEISLELGFASQVEIIFTI